MRFLTLFLAALGAMGQGITQEGSDWVRTISGTLPAVPRAGLHVQSQGRIVLRGVTGDRVTYKLTERVKARSEDEAEQKLSGGMVVPRLLSGVMVILAQGASPFVATTLEVSVPRQVRGAALEVLYGGDIEAYDFDGGVEAQTPAGAIRGNNLGSLTARTGGGRIQLGKIGGNVDCFTGADSIVIESASGQVHCQTAGGEITVTEAGGGAELSSEGGNISVGRAGGLVVADTRGGSIQVGSARGVRLESGAGAVKVRGSSGPMNVSTAIGSILAELMAGTSLQNSSLAAAAGDVTVLIPSNLGVSVMAINENGGSPRLVSDFPEVRVQPLGFARPPAAQGAINGGGPVLRISTGRGVIYLRKSK